VTRHDGGAPVLTDDGNNGGWRGQQCAQQWQRQMVRRAKWGGSLASIEEEEGNRASAWPLCRIRVRHARGGGGCMGCTWSGAGERSTAST
jgi:hypothetical protein